MKYTAIFHCCINVNCYLFLLFAQNIDCRYTLEPPHGGGSNEYTQSMRSKKYVLIGKLNIGMGEISVVTVTFLLTNSRKNNLTPSRLKCYGFATG